MSDQSMRPDPARPDYLGTTRRQRQGKPPRPGRPRQPRPKVTAEGFAQGAESVATFFKALAALVFWGFIAYIAWLIVFG